MTGAAEKPRGLVRKIARTFCDSVFTVGGVTVQAGNLGSAHPLVDHLTDNCCVDQGAGVIVANRAVGTVQGIHIGITDQGASAG